MRLPIFPVLGAFLSVAVFCPFVLMFAGPALSGNTDAAQVGLYLLLNVNPVAIPSLLFLLGVTWVFRRLGTASIPSKPDVVPAPRPHAQTCAPVLAPRARWTVPNRDVVIDVVAVQPDARSSPFGGHRPLTSTTLRPAIAFHTRDGLQR